MRSQLVISPFHGESDLTPLARDDHVPGALDPVSLADVLRNGFVYPPHSIYDNIRLASCGFDPHADLFATPRYEPMYRPLPLSGYPPRDWAGEYHQRLCEAVTSSCAGMTSPWLLQSGGKDSTSLAIAMSEARPDVTCVTYLGGDEENEVASARHVARRLGLRHEAIMCDAARAYDRYLRLVPNIPLLTADFALLSYVDVGVEVHDCGGDGVVDGLGSDVYLGVPGNWHRSLLRLLARRIRLPRIITESPWLPRSFAFRYLLASVQMDPIERDFPGSRFTDGEVDGLFGRPIAHESHARLATFAHAFEVAGTLSRQLSVTLEIFSCAGGIGKALYSMAALSMPVAFPYCDVRLWKWVEQSVPDAERMDDRSGINKVLVREHIARYFPSLPYVRRKGSFRFNVRELARERFDSVWEIAGRTRDLLPGARPWLDRNRHRLDNKYDASKFYLLAVVLPWLEAHAGVDRRIDVAAKREALGERQ